MTPRSYSTSIHTIYAPFMCSAHLSQTDGLSPRIVGTLYVLYTFRLQGHHQNGDRAARRLQISCSICVHSFGALAKAVQLFTASLHNLSMYPKMCSTHIFINLKGVGWNSTGDFSTPNPVWGFKGDVGDGGWGHSIAHPLVHISSHWHI